MPLKQARKTPGLSLVLRGRAYGLIVSMSQSLSWNRIVKPLLALQQALPLGREEHQGITCQK